MKTFERKQDHWQSQSIDLEPTDSPPQQQFYRNHSQQNFKPLQDDMRLGNPHISQNSQNSPKRRRNDTYEEYRASVYYQIQKDFRDQNGLITRKRGSYQTPKNYQENQKIQLGLGDPHNLKAFENQVQGQGQGGIETPRSNFKPHQSSITERKIHAPKSSRGGSLTGRNSIDSRTPLSSRSVRSNSGFMQPPTRKFSPAQSSRSGQRLYNNSFFYKNKRNDLVSEREKQINSQMKQKPTINKKSIDLLGAKERLRERQQRENNFDFCKHEEPQEFLSYHNHANCYFNKKKCEELAECTHQPKINEKSRAILENKVLQQIQQPPKPQVIRITDLMKIQRQRSEAQIPLKKNYDLPLQKNYDLPLKRNSLQISLTREEYRKIEEQKFGVQNFTPKQLDLTFDKVSESFQKSPLNMNRSPKIFIEEQFTSLRSRLESLGVDLPPPKKQGLEERINSKIRAEKNEDTKSNKSKRSDYQARSKKNFIKLNKKQLDKIQSTLNKEPKPNIFEQKNIKVKNEKLKLVSNQNFYQKSMLWKKSVDQKIQVKQEQHNTNPLPPPLPDYPLEKSIYSSKTTDNNIYANYHIYRAENAPQTYREVIQQKKQYEKQKNPDVVLRTDIRSEQKKIKTLEKMYEEKQMQDQENQIKQESQILDQKLKQKQDWYEQKQFEQNLLAAIEEREQQMLESMKEQRPMQMVTIESQEQMPIRQYHSDRKDMIYEPAVEEQVWRSFEQQYQKPEIIQHEPNYRYEPEHQRYQPPQQPIQQRYEPRQQERYIPQKKRYEQNYEPEVRCEPQYVPDERYEPRQHIPEEQRYKEIYMPESSRNHSSITFARDSRYIQPEPSYPESYQPENENDHHYSEPELYYQSSGQSNLKRVGSQYLDETPVRYHEQYDYDQSPNDLEFTLSKNI